MHRLHLPTGIAALVAVATLSACSGAASDGASSTGQTSVAASSAEDSAAAGTADANADETTIDAAADDAADDAGADSSANVAEAAATAEAAVASDAATADWDAGDEIAIDLADGATSVDGSNVSVDGDTITILASGTYRISGTLSDGQIVVDADDGGLVRLVLDGADVTSSTTSALYVDKAGEVVVWLADGSTNHLADGGGSDVAEDEPNAALLSEADLTIAGTGSLAVEGNRVDGITGKDDLVIVSGTIEVTAVDDGLRGKDNLVIAGGDISVSAGGDGLTSDNEDASDDGDTNVGNIVISGGTLAITADTDGMDAVATISISGGEISIAAGDDGVHADAQLSISAGSIDVTQSYEGLESAIIEISDGDISIVSSDDGINVAGGADGSGQQGPGGGGRGGGDQFAANSDYYALISGGTISIDAQGDGLDSNGSMEITGGTIVVNGPTGQGNGALDVNGTFTIENATLIAVGSAGMAETPSGPQAIIAARFGSGVSAGTVITITDANGDLVVAFETQKTAESLVFSSAALVSGDSYTVSLGGTIDGTTVGGLLVDGSANGGDEAGTVTAT